MGFASGTVSFRRFSVAGKQPKAIDQELLDKLSAHALRVSEDGMPPDVDYGWCGGRHVLDAAFNFEHNVYGEALSFAMRTDTNKVPGDLKRAFQMMEEDAVAAGNPSGFISKLQKKQVKETIAQAIDDELRSGKYRRSKMSSLLWDFSSQCVYAAVGGAAQERLLELFERSFRLELAPMSAGTMALTSMQARGHRRDYEDLRPTRFVAGPDGEGQHPEYPWTAKGPEPKDFVGNEFLLWLWHQADLRDGAIQTEDAGEVTIFIDKVLELDCAYGQTGKDSLRGDGPTRMPEARDALRSGKVPRKAGIVLDAKRQQFSMTFNSETFGFSSARLPEIEDADTPRVVFEERVELMRDMCQATDALFDTFLKIRCSSAWEGNTSAIRKWIHQSTKPVAAVA